MKRGGWRERQRLDRGLKVLAIILFSTHQPNCPLKLYSPATTLHFFYSLFHLRPRTTCNLQPLQVSSFTGTPAPCSLCSNEKHADA